jgi:transcriptional regulator with XRE-family HTH domain
VADPLSRTLAARLREERRRLRLSLRRLAAMSGLSPTTVHQIETGRGSPSLATLQTLATTLGVPVAALFEAGAPQRSAAVFVSAKKRPRARIPGGSLDRLAAGLPGQRLRGLVVTLSPGAATGEEAMSHPGQELVLGLAGRCGYEVAGREYRLSPGDSLLVDSRQPHRAHNTSSRDAQILLVLYVPEEKPTWLARHTRPASRARSPLPD